MSPSRDPSSSGWRLQVMLSAKDPWVLEGWEMLWRFSGILIPPGTSWGGGCRWVTAQQPWHPYPRARWPQLPMPLPLEQG